MKKDEDHLPGRISISISWLMAGGPPGIWGPHKTHYKTHYRKGRPACPALDSEQNNSFEWDRLYACIWSGWYETGI